MQLGEPLRPDGEHLPGQHVPATHRLDPGVPIGCAGRRGGPAEEAALNNPRQLTFGPDGRLYVADEDNHRIRAIDFESSTIETVVGSGEQGFSGDGGSPLEASLDRPAGVAFDREGRRVATVGADAIVRVWDAESGAELLQLAGHTDRIYAVAFHPEGRLIASGSNDTTIRLWDLDRGLEVGSLLGHRSYVYGLDFSPDGATLASASGDNTVRLWSTRTMAERHARASEARARKAGR